MRTLIFLFSLIVVFGPLWADAQILQEAKDNPIISYTKNGSFDTDSVYYPKVFKDAGDWFLYYAGLFPTNHIEIGLATSPDGYVWQKDTSNPVFVCGDNTVPGCASNVNWSSYRVGPLGVIKEDGIFKMWYKGNAYNIKAPYAMGYATSSDGIHWSAYKNNPVFADYEGLRMGFSSVVKFNNKYLSYFHDQTGFYVAVSSDGIEWQDRSDAVLVSNIPLGSFSVIGDSIVAIDQNKYPYLSKDGFTFEKISDEAVVDDVLYDRDGQFIVDNEEIHYYYSYIDVGGLTIKHATGTFEQFGITDEEDESTIDEVVEDLGDVINGLDKNVRNALWAHLKKIETFIENGQYRAALEQVNALEQKVTDYETKGDITSEQAEEMLSLIIRLSELLIEKSLAVDVSGVPLMTQIESPYPSVEETSTWAGDTYANGSAVSLCGTTIAQCGCAITSLSMIARSYGIDKGIDGSDVNPGNMNEWLEANKGYTGTGNILWGKGLEYLGKQAGNKVLGNLSMVGKDVTTVTTYDDFLATMGPVMAFSAAKGHYFVLTDKNADGSYDVSDPWWYNTVTTNDVKDAANYVQAYNNVVTDTNLFAYSKTPVPSARLVEIHLASPAELILTDSQGRQTGFVGGSVVTNIPGSSYDQNEFISDPGGASVGDSHPEKVLMVLLPEDDIYTLEVVGTGEGEYHLSVLTAGEGEVSEVNYEVRETSLGHTDTFVVEVDGGDEVEDLIAAIEALIADWDEHDQDYVLNKLRVIASQFEKENMVAVDAVMAQLLRFVNGIDAGNAAEVLALLELL